MRAEILLATHNGEAFLRPQLESILAQSDSRWHLTLSDDGSTDGTCAVLDEYAARYPEKITHLRSGKRFGSARDHFLYLMRRCDADRMLFCDQDDVWHADKLALTMDALDQAGDGPALVFTDLRPVDARMREIAPSMAAYQHRPVHCLDWRSLLLQNTANGCTMGFNRALADLAGQCREDAALPMHDSWLAATAARFGKLIYLDVPTVDYRQHGSNSVGASDVRSANYVIRRLSALGQLRRMILGKKAQARVFHSTYASMLNEEDLAFLTGFEKRFSGPLFYWRYRRLIHSLYHRMGLMVLG